MRRLLAICVFLAVSFVGRSQQLFYVSDALSNLHLIDLENCTYETIGNVGVYLDLAYTPDGTLYGLNAAAIYEIELPSGNSNWVGSFPGDFTSNSMVSDDNGVLYITGLLGEIWTFDPSTGVSEMIGNSGVWAAGDLAFVNGELWVVGSNESTVGTNLYSIPLDDPSLTELVFPNVPFDTFGIFTIAEDCNNFSVYITQETNVIWIDLENTQQVPVCDEMDINGIEFYGAASVTESLTSTVDCAAIDLDSDNSSGASGSDYLADSLCVTWTFPVADLDAEIHTENDELDSLHIFLDAGIQDVGDEILVFPSDGIFDVVGNNTEELWVYNSGDLPLTTASEYLGDTWYLNNNASPSFGQRSIGVVGYSDGFYTDTAYAYINLFPYPEISVTPEQTICEGELAEFVVTGEAEHYVWSSNDTGASISVGDAGVYTIEAANGNCAVSANTELFVIPAIEVQLPDDIVDCDGNVIEINATGSGDYLWSNGVEAPVIFVNESGWYSCQVSNSCFTEVDSIHVVIVDFPDDLLGDRKSLCVGDSVELIPSYLEGNFLWSTEQTSPTIFIGESGTYGVEIDHWGCITSDEVEVVFAEKLTFEDLLLPNVFSPNHDEKNAWFRPVKKTQPNRFLCALEGVNFDMRVFDRWGGIVSDHSCHWEGLTPTGDEAGEDTYYYIMTLSSCDSKVEERHGYVQLLRD